MRANSCKDRGFAGAFKGGASRDRTGDLLLAKQALSQLSYGPGADSSLTVEIEVPGWALLEPQPVVIRRVLEEVRGLLEHVLLTRLTP